MDQNPQINIIANENDPFLSANNNGFDTYSQSSSNTLYNDVNATCNYGFSVLNANAPITSTDGHYHSNNASTDIQNSVMDISSSFSNMTFNSPFIQTSHSEIIRYEIPGYDVIFIPKPSPIVPIVQQDCNFLNNSSSVNPAQLNQQQDYVYSVGGSSSPANAINTHNNQFTVVGNSQHQYQHSQSLLGLNGSFSNFNSFRG